jgi:hypothetical protein
VPWAKPVAGNARPAASARRRNFFINKGKIVWWKGFRPRPLSFVQN